MKGGALLTTGEKTTFEKEGGAWSRSGSSSEPDELISITDLFRPVTQLITHQRPQTGGYISIDIVPCSYLS